MWGEYWIHEEINECGSVIARYESCEELNAQGQVNRGWRKYDASGHLVDVQSVCASWVVRTRRPSAFARIEPDGRANGLSLTCIQLGSGRPS